MSRSGGSSAMHRSHTGQELLILCFNYLMFTPNISMTESVISVTMITALLLVPDALVWGFQKLQISWYFHSLHSMSVKNVTWTFFNLQLSSYSEPVPSVPQIPVPVHSQMLFCSSRLYGVVNSVTVAFLPSSNQSACPFSSDQSCVSVHRTAIHWMCFGVFSTHILCKP